MLTYQAMLALQVLVWNTGAEHGEVGPVRIALTILAGGAMLILLGRLARSESVDELIADAGAAQPGHARRILVTALAAIVAIAFGGAVGPEAGLLAVVAPVSYTHLDVYKRQGQRSPLRASPSAPSARPVSYTHLDVYKRQVDRS